MSDTAYKIKVMQAYLQRKRIQIKHKGKANEWYTCAEDSTITWNWDDCDYRIKPEPREFWVNVFPSDIKMVDSSYYAYSDKEHAKARCSSNEQTVHVREVMGEC